MNSSTDPRISSIWISHTGIDEWTWRVGWRYRVTHLPMCLSGVEASYVGALRAMIAAVQEHAEEVSNGSDD